jgi:glycosyltransferase involved in cell wall biosynthesis
MNKVSIITPIFKVRNFIERCVCSLFEQTLEDVEYIFVDDASPDDSVDILRSCIERYPSRKDQVTILTHGQNKGLPAARNTGLALATGEYVYHCDSDDFVEKDMLEVMYNVAKEKDADIVYSDFYLSFEKNERYMSCPSYETASDMLKVGLLGGSMKYNVWNKLVKRSLYTDNNITFPDGHAMGEDMTVIRLAACAKSVVYVPKAFYHYVKLNSNAYSATMSERHKVDIRFNVNQTVEFLQNKFGNALEKEIAFFKLNTKLPFLITDDATQYEVWKEWWPEANKYICENKDQAFRTRLVQWLAAKGQFWAVMLYFKVIYKLVYGVIYR